jgi:hypothetical protein
MCILKNVYFKGAHVKVRAQMRILERCILTRCIRDGAYLKVHVLNVHTESAFSKGVYFNDAYLHVRT